MYIYNLITVFLGVISKFAQSKHLGFFMTFTTLPQQ
jgi:hypothetical protein